MEKFVKGDVVIVPFPIPYSLFPVPSIPYSLFPIPCSLLTYLQ
jgi:hypothetical protein